MTPTQRQEIAKKLRELADLIEPPPMQAAPNLYPEQIGRCNCHDDFKRGTYTGGWLCPIHGRQF